MEPSTEGGRDPEPVVIKVRNNGPYKVTGPVTLIDADGNEFEIPEGDGIVLCRCGASTTKPFCDKTHSKIGFEAAERAVEEAEGSVDDAGERSG
jgi:CDGSH-type Zn-finger protein